MNKLIYVKKFYIIICLIIFPVLFSAAQERIVTANEYLNFVSAQYGSIEDYEAKVTNQGQGEDVRNHILQNPVAPPDQF